MHTSASTKLPAASLGSLSKPALRQRRPGRRRGRRRRDTWRQVYRSNLLTPLSPFVTLLLLVVLFPANIWIEGAPVGEDTPHVTRRRFRDPKATFYELLGVAKRASQEEIKRVFRKLAVKMHPDKLGPFQSEEAEIEANTIFMKILKAYEILGDPAQRQKYDLSGMNEDTGDFPFEAEPERRYEDTPFGIFARFGSGRGGLWFRYKGHGTRRAPDSVVALPLTFEEVFEGKTANVTVTRTRLCRTCGGTGATEPPKMPTCKMCEGKGYAYHLFGVHESSDHGHKHGHHSHTSGGIPGGRCSVREDGSNSGGGGSEEAGADPDIPGYAHAVNTTCKVCGGTGKISDGGCLDCRGRRVKLETETFEVSMPAGVLPGHTVHFGGQGTQHPDKLPGNVRVIATQLSHPRFERQGADLVYKKKISLLDALQGFDRMLTLLDGSRVRIVHDQVTLSGYRQELPNLGFPVAGTDSGDGDGERGALIVDFEVDFPRELREAHLVALRAVLTEEEISVLEDVLQLMSTRKAESWRPDMDPLEYRYTRFCSIEEHYDEQINTGGADSGKYMRGEGVSDIDTLCCIPDLLWWVRPWLGDYFYPGHVVDSDIIHDDEDDGEGNADDGTGL